MIREICRDTRLLRKKSVPATKEDAEVIRDLRDTLRANREHCVGMAANMIGVNKRIIIFSSDIMDIVMVNPRITKKTDPYRTEESCLSLTGVRKTVRFDRIEVTWLDPDFKPRKGSFSGFTAQIIQHECDHLEGIIR